MTTDQLIPAIMLMLVFVALVALIWRQTLTLARLAGIHVRGRDRERHDVYNLIERLLEKRDTSDGFRTAEMHRTERLRQGQIDADVDKNAERPPMSPAKQEEDRFCDVDSSEYEN